MKLKSFVAGVLTPFLCIACAALVSSVVAYSHGYQRGLEQGATMASESWQGVCSRTIDLAKYWHEAYEELLDCQTKETTTVQIVQQGPEWVDPNPDYEVPPLPPGGP